MSKSSGDERGWVFSDSSKNCSMVLENLARSRGVALLSLTDVIAIIHRRGNKRTLSRINDDQMTSTFQKLHITLYCLYFMVHPTTSRMSISSGPPATISASTVAAFPLITASWSEVRPRCGLTRES